ncbi:MAG TPA: protoporphyrinogen oxidase [Thermoanaerobaculia bacterium]|nr:protoporphyrinogen oxidase [Thermoanaerobaculia bacterium]
MTQTIVVGAGLSGLVRGHALAARGEDVLVLEAGPRPGGVVWTDSIDGYIVERGPNTVRPAPELWSLVSDLGLLSEVQIASPMATRYLDFGERLQALPTSLFGLLGTGLLSARGKLRLFAEPFVRRRGRDDESVRDFFERRLGHEVAARFVEPFVSGIFAGDAQELAAAAVFPFPTEMENRYRSLLAGAILGRKVRPPAAVRPPRGLLSFRHGLATLPRAMATALGNRLRLNSPVRQIERTQSGWRVATEGGAFEAERLLVAAPADASAALVKTIAPEASAALSAIPSPALAVLHLAWPANAFARPPEGFGYLVVPQASRRILGCLWTASLFPGRAPEGQALLTIFLGGRLDPNAAALSDSELVAVAAKDVRAAMGVRGEPRVVALTRWARAIPQYDRGHAARMKALADCEARCPGLAFLGNYRGGVSVGDVVRNALAG